MAAHARSTRPEPTPRRRYALRHPGRAAGALGALLVLGGLAATGVASAATEFDVRFLGDVSVHDDTTGANCHYHIDEEFTGFVAGDPFEIDVEPAAPSDACGSVQSIFVSLGTRPGQDIHTYALFGARHNGVYDNVLGESGAYPSTGGTRTLEGDSRTANGMTLTLHSMTVAVVAG